MAKIHLFTNAERKLFQWLKGIFVDRVTPGFPLQVYPNEKKINAYYSQLLTFMVVLRFTLQNDVFSCIDIASGYILDYFCWAKYCKIITPTDMRTTRTRRRRSGDFSNETCDSTEFNPQKPEMKTNHPPSSPPGIMLQTSKPISGIFQLAMFDDTRG